MHRSKRGTRPPRIERVAAPGRPRGEDRVMPQERISQRRRRPPAASKPRGLNSVRPHFPPQMRRTPSDVRTRVARAGQRLMQESRAASRQQNLQTTNYLAARWRRKLPVQVQQRLSIGIGVTPDCSVNVIVIVSFSLVRHAGAMPGLVSIGVLVADL